MTFGTLLSQIREQAGLSQAELAKRSGVSRATILRYEADDCEPSLYPAVRILTILGADIGVLQGLTLLIGHKPRPPRKDNGFEASFI